VVVKRFQANNSNFCRSRARASLRDQPLALPAWDQQEETEQSDSLNAWRNPIEGGKNQTVEIAETQPLWRFSSLHIELVAQRQDLRLERSS
jgi:hypothetical protein